MTSKVKKIGVIYCYSNLLNGKCYIGQTIRERERMNEHYNAAFNKNKKSKFYNALRKYGKSNFNYSVLESVILYEGDDVKSFKEKLNQLEKQYITLYNSYDNGYNGTIGGNAVDAWLSQVDENHQYLHRSPVRQIDIVTNKTIATFDSISDAGRSLGKPHQSISKVCYNLLKTAYGYRWEYILLSGALNNN